MAATTPLHGKRPPGWKHKPMPLRGKKILVTGGTTGIGRTTALLLAWAGAEVFVFGRDEQHLHDALNVLRKVSRRVHGMNADIAGVEGAQTVFDAVEHDMGGLDILINNAGLPAESVDSEDPDNMRYVVQANLLGYLECAQRAVKLMKERGGGHIVNVGSMSAESRGKESDIYVATKSGIRGFSQSLTKQLAEQNIRVTLVEPGLTGADLFPDKKGEPKTQRKMQAKLQMLTSEDIAEAVFFALTQPQRSNVVMMQVHQLISGE